MKGMPMADVMVRALLAGAKTQTRRIHRQYEVGDVVYIREAWRPLPAGGPMVMFRADGDTKPWPDSIRAEYHDVLRKHPEGWRPPMFMFRELARLHYEVIEHREERLQHITREDAIAEGSWWRVAEETGEHSWRAGLVDDPVQHFARAWDTIQDLDAHPDRAWAANPLIHAYTLKPTPPFAFREVGKHTDSNMKTERGSQGDAARSPKVAATSYSSARTNPPDGRDPTPRPSKRDTDPCPATAKGSTESHPSGAHALQMPQEEAP